ncbi:MAG: cytidylate kinase [Candidatus Marinimicrobia bacterium]|nr:cytidylate kinase [Candidatus Neomarinimicrobiota bacterium]MBF89394.1 cytidylate kinase [Candidatus Neomarinimicrobiota bacterium]
MIVAIDGLAGSGKSTTARNVALELGFLYLDTGAMYRAVTMAVLLDSIDLKDEEAIKDCVASIEIDFDRTGSRVYLNKKDISREIRGQMITANVSAVSALPKVREKMVDLQRKIAGKRDSVVEGRDIGTVVFPDADIKFFMTAEINERAKRRRKDLLKLNIKKKLKEVVEDLDLRDQLDSTRDLAPLMKADDAIEVNTTIMTINQQIDLIVSHIKEWLDKKES